MEKILNNEDGVYEDVELGFGICHCDNPTWEEGVVGDSDQNFTKGQEVDVCTSCVGFRAPEAI